ncbi:hypothetical protein [uncultured Fusobacterium sp.]|uniref:hypothetical protein n=1 Tax=uncultured Fusobacterium sp. TaxID=159267 RepID=UPI0025FA45FE|nr:hypothetical protein [uncultured Fusobacterium sp.]
MITMREKLELEELEKLNKLMDEEIEDNDRELETDSRFGATILLVSYCGIGLFMFYKIAELLVKRFS